VSFFVVTPRQAALIRLLAAAFLRPFRLTLFNDLKGGMRSETRIRKPENVSTYKE
jgi:hypothetical protein